MSSATEVKVLRESNAQLLAQNTTLALNLNRMRRELDVWFKTKRVTGNALSSADEAEQEVARLTRLLETERQEHKAELTALRSYTADLEFVHISTLNSSSWRLTAPLRNAIRRIRGLPAQAPFVPRYLDPK